MAVRSGRALERNGGEANFYDQILSSSKFESCKFGQVCARLYSYVYYIGRASTVIQCMAPTSETTSTGAMKESNNGCLFVPPKQNKQHKPRTVKTQPAAASPPPEPLQQPVATTVAIPLSVPMWQLPFAAVSPLPMQQVGYFPPRF